MGYSWVQFSTLNYTSELILCSTICVHSATRHNIHVFGRAYFRICERNNLKRFIERSHKLKERIKKKVITPPIVSFSNDMQFTNCTTRKSLFHDPYNSYESLTCIYPLSLSNDIQFTNRTTRKSLSHDPYDLYESWKREDVIARIVSICIVENLGKFKFHPLKLM